MISIRCALVLLLGLNLFGFTNDGQLIADENSTAAMEWKIDSQEQWEANSAKNSNLKFEDGFATPTEQTASFQSHVKSFPEKRTANSLVVAQSPIWQNWNPIEPWTI